MIELAISIILGALIGITTGCLLFGIGFGLGRLIRYLVNKKAK